MKPNKIRLFIKPGCPWCHEAIAWLEARGVAYEKLDVLAEAGAFRDMMMLSGQTSAPVIDVDGHVLADFDTGQLETFWKRLDLA